MTQATHIQALDLTKEFPRSPAAMLGDYILLPRVIDKCRAFIAGTQGEYHYECPLTNMFLDFVGISAEDFKNEVAKGLTDEEILAWVKTRTVPRTETEILAWAYDCRNWTPETPESKAYLEKTIRGFSQYNPYINNFFQMLEADEGRLKPPYVI